MSAIEEKQDQHHLKDTINDLKNVKIIHTNYKQYVDIVRNKCEIIETQIQSLLSRYNIILDKLKETEENERVKQLLKEGKIVPMEIYNLRRELNSVTEDLMVWRTLEEQMLEIMFIKMSAALAAVKSLDIEREVTRGLKDMNTAYFGFMKEHVMDKNAQMEKKIVDFQNQVNTRFETLTHKMINLIATKIIESQREDGKVSIKAKEMEEIDKVGEQKDYIKSKQLKETGVIEKLKVSEEEDEGVGDEFECEICGEKTDNEAQLASHMKLIHKEG